MERQRVTKPIALKPGDQIGIISPAGPLRETDLQEGLSIMETSGFGIRIAPHVYDKQGYLAGKDEVRLGDLHAMFQDPAIKAIFCARGGYGCLRLLDKIDYGLIKKNPKIFVGYSDVTALMMAIYNKTGLITIHGPMVRDLSRKNQDHWQNLRILLTSGGPPKIGLIEGGGAVLVPGKATGKLLGGNLSLICHLVGTSYLPSFEGCILFIEETAEPLYRLDRMLTHLALSGRLKGLSGIITGELENCGPSYLVQKLLLEKLTDLGIPVAAGLPIGHGSRNLPLPMGLKAELDTHLMTLSVTESCLVG
jgi:muramoyltetrapeptide carboxypeptidase